MLIEYDICCSSKARIQSRALSKTGSPDGGGLSGISDSVIFVFCFAFSNLAFNRLRRAFLCGFDSLSVGYSKIIPYFLHTDCNSLSLSSRGFVHWLCDVLFSRVNLCVVGE